MAGEPRERIEKLRKKPVEVETMVWDGSDEAAAAIKAWVGCRQVDVSTPTSGPATMDGEQLFLLTHEMSGVARHALLWVAHNHSWSPLPVGYRVARELDGSGFYPLSPEGAAAGYEMPEVDRP